TVDRPRVELVRRDEVLDRRGGPQRARELLVLEVERIEPSGLVEQLTRAGVRDPVESGLHLRGGELDDLDAELGGQQLARRVDTRIARLRQTDPRDARAAQARRSGRTAERAEYLRERLRVVDPAHGELKRPLLADEDARQHG